MGAFSLLIRISASTLLSEDSLNTQYKKKNLSCQGFDLHFFLLANQALRGFIALNSELTQVSANLSEG